MGFTLCKSFNIVILVPKVLPKSYFRKYNLPCFSYIHLFLFFCTGLKSFSQPASYNDRAAFFDQLEERARLLSDKLFEFANSDSNSTDDRSGKFGYDGSRSIESDWNASYVRFSDNNLTSSDFSGEGNIDESPKRVFMEEQIGRYFIQPFIGMSVPPHQISFKGLAHSAEIKTEIGHAVGINLGRRWKNFDAEVHYGYINTEFKKTIFPFPYSSPKHTSGQSELFNGGARLGYGLPFGDGGWFRFATGIGFANRKDVLNLDQLGEISTYYGTETIFTYDFLFSLGYEIKKDLDVFVAYRVLAMNGKGDFDEATMHLLELGLGANF